MLTTAEIKRFIDDDFNSEFKRFASVGQRYYEARHDILDSRLFYIDDEGKLQEDKTRSNIKISHPFFTELADQLSAYMLSFKENPIRAKESASGLQEHLDSYFDDEFWAEIGELITGSYVKGFDYLYARKNDDNKTVFQSADGMGVVEVRATDTDDGCKYVIYWYIDRIDKGRKTIKRIQVWNEKEVAFFVQSGEGKIIEDKSEKINPRPHAIYTDPKTKKQMGFGLGYIPFWRLDNCKKKFSGLKPIKAIIDDYDLHACSLSNNLVDFDTPVYVVTGFPGQNLDELHQNLKTKKVVGIPDSEGDVQVRTVSIPYEARKEKLEIDEKNIYRFGMGLNTLALKDTAATTNIAIKTAYALLKMKADKLEKRLKKLLKEIIKVVLAEINTENKKAYEITDIYFDFERETMVNETENVQNQKMEAETRQLEINTILNLASYIDDEQILKAICEVMDWNYDELKDALDKLREEQNTANAKAVLEGVVPDDDSVVVE